MAVPFESGVFTYTLTNAVLTITGSDNVRAISIYNSSAVVGTIQGNETIGVTTSTAINIGENESYNYLVPEDTYVIKNLVITAPTSCTLIITATKWYG